MTRAKIFITGSADGLGELAARLLLEHGHHVVLHARTEARAREAQEKNPAAETVLTGDLSHLGETRELAAKANAHGIFDAVIHNAGVYQTSGKKIFAVNTVAPYVLTSLMHKPKRLVYLSSGMHTGGKPNLDYIKTDVDSVRYSDSKLHVVMLMLAVARAWPDVYANAVDPGWVPTKMGGKSAPDDLRKGYETQSWLATSDEPRAKVSGHYFFHQKQRQHNTVADDVAQQEKLLSLLGEMTGVAFKG